MGKSFLKVRKDIKESIVRCYSDRRQAIDAAFAAIQFHRQQLESYISTHPQVLHALHPVKLNGDVPRVVDSMHYVTEPLGIGPMAAVAGVLADFAVESMLENDVTVAAVENGGEIFVHTTQKPFNIGLYAGTAPISSQMGFQILPSDCPIGVGTSSGTVGHAFSFGKADAATVFAENAAIADAAATAVCNTVRGRDIQQSVETGINFAKSLPIIRGAVIVRGDYIGSTGFIPKLLKIRD
ncbi:MAG: UPF0280 family protein [Candidatus Bathyarchaeota archaeon]|nr:UPF0280 family protein [Candidatus Bathyarchaeota archaeon]